MSFFFFFQAEDGIRDLVRSRGLGDVYKRQVLYNPRFGDEANSTLQVQAATVQLFADEDATIEAVSYTHLTLPTSDLV